jgi:hypothetical protein
MALSINHIRCAAIIMFIWVWLSPSFGLCEEQFNAVEDTSTGVRITLPLGILSKVKTTNLGQSWSSPDDRIIINTFSAPSSDTLEAVYSRISKVKGRVLSRSELKGDSFILEGNDSDGSTFFVSAKQQGGAIRGLSVITNEKKKGEYSSLRARGH